MPLARLFYPVFLLGLSLLLLLIILPLTRHGMFLDGIIYAAIAKNLSLGHGSLWQPFYSQTHFPLFYEHPPLVFYLEAQWFKLFGSGFMVERLYCLCMAFAQFFLIFCYWLKKQQAAFIQGGLLLFIWLLIPLNQLYISNLLEGTLTFFTTVAAFLLLIKTSSQKGFWLLLILSAQSIVIAFFCNGPTAFFPLAIPVIQSLIKEQAVSLAVKKTAALIFFCALSLLVIYTCIPGALENTQHYFHQQLLAAISGKRQMNYTGLNHLHIVLLFLRAYWPVSTFALGCLVIAALLCQQRIGHYCRTQWSPSCSLFFLLALVSSLPVGISHRQALNYIMQSSPFFTLFIMFLCKNSFQTIAHCVSEKRRAYQSLLGACLCVFFASLGFTIVKTNGFNRHALAQQDIQYLRHYCKEDAVLSTSKSIYYEWYTGAYLARESMISLSPERGHTYYLGLKNEPLPKHYHSLHLPLNYYQLAMHD